MVMDQESDPSHPGVETLAAFVDGLLDSRRKSDVERHLADCGGCYELVVEVVRERRTASPGTAKKPLGTILRWPRSWGGTAVLAAAAVVLLAVVIESTWLPWAARSDGAETRLAALVATVGEQRTIDGRLTGGFKHGPVPPRTRSANVDAASLALRAEAAQAQETAAADPSAGNRHVAAIAQVLLGSHDHGITTLEELARNSKTDRVLSDLAAAYLARAAGSDTPQEDLIRGRASAEQAMAMNPQLVEAYFNRALALTRLGRAADARGAWAEYLKLDPASAWATEALGYLRELESRSPAAK
jgi:anti-sigma factor RsiW